VDRAGASRLEGLAPALLVAAAALAAHHPILWNGFIRIDDPLYLTSNAEVRAGLTLDGVRWAFTSLHAFNWHPLTWLSHMADVSAWGMDPRGHHLVGLLLHAINAVLLYSVLRRATGATWRAAAVALLFAVHPVHVESVAWAAERKDLLSTFFLLLAMRAYVGPERRVTARGRWVALAFFGLGLLAKPMIVTLPVLLLVLDVWPLGRLAAGERLRALVLEKVPFAVLSAGSAAVTLVAQHQSGQGAILHESPLWLNAGNAVVGYVRYLGLLVWPLELAPVYPFRASAVTALPVLGGVGVLALLTGVALAQRRARPWLLAGWCWYLVALLPVAGFIRIGYHALADRYLYVPALGLYLAAVWTAAELAGELRSPVRRTLAVGFAALLAVLASLTVAQARRWESTVTLLEYALALYPDNPLPHRALGAAYAEAGRLDLAVLHVKQGRLLEALDIVQLNPDAADAHHQLGVAYAEHGRDEEALAEFRRAIALDAGSAKSLVRAGQLLTRLGRLEEAREAFAAASRLDAARGAGMLPPGGGP